PGNAPLIAPAPPGTAPPMLAPVGPAGPPPGAPFVPPPRNGPPAGAALTQPGLDWPSSEEIKQFKRRKGFLIAGATLFGLAYYVALPAGSVGISRNNRGSREWSAALVPFGGPFVAAGLRAEPNQKPFPGQPPPSPQNPLPSQQQPDYT